MDQKRNVLSFFPNSFAESSSLGFFAQIFVQQWGKAITQVRIELPYDSTLCFSLTRRITRKRIAHAINAQKSELYIDMYGQQHPEIGEGVANSQRNKHGMNPESVTRLL